VPLVLLIVAGIATKGFYAKFIGVGVVAYCHDAAWAYIFRSQLLMLMELNGRNGLIPVAHARIYYDQAAAKYAECPSCQFSNSVVSNGQADRPDKYSFYPIATLQNAELAFRQPQNAKKRDARFQHV